MEKRRRFFWNAAVMTAGCMILRFTGLWFRSCITERIGASGMGLYQLIFSLYALGITVCTSGIGLAVTRMVAEGRGTRQCIRSCLRFALGMSFAAAGVLFVCAGFISNRLIGAPGAAAPLRILAAGLPFLAACSCLKGYFFAVRNTVVPMCGEFWEQLVTVGLSLLLLDRSPLPPLDALMLGSSLGEVSSVLYIVPLFLHFAHKNGLPDRKDPAVMKTILHIAGPMLFGSFLRSSLFSTENLLIPVGLRKYGAGGIAAMAQYGVMQGMVMPILLFPLSLISSVAMLLIPELAEANAGGDPEAIRRSAEKAFRATLLFGFLSSAFFIVFAEELGTLFFGSPQAGTILRIMAPIAPLMYLDNVVDNMLKGLDQQVYSLKVNFSDASMRVLLISFLVPVFGIKAYLAILFASEIYNAALSIGKLIRTAHLRVDILAWIVTPAVAGGLLYYLLSALKKAFEILT